MRILRARRGATLVELIVTVSILGVVAAGLVRLMSSQSRFFSDNEGQANARRVARSPMTLMLSDIRMADADSSLIGAAADSFALRIPYRIGTSCGNAGGITTVAFPPIDSVVNASASMLGYGWVDTNGPHYVAGGALGTGAGATCFAAGIDTFPQAGLVKTLPLLASVTVGTPVFAYQRIVYSIRNSVIVPGTKGLFRTVGGGAPEEIGSPLAATSSFQFRLAGGGVTATPTIGTTILGVDVKLVGLNERNVTNGKTQTSPVETTIYFKNR